MKWNGNSIQPVRVRDGGASIWAAVRRIANHVEKATAAVAVGLIMLNVIEVNRNTAYTCVCQSPTRARAYTPVAVAVFDSMKSFRPSSKRLFLNANCSFQFTLHFMNGFILLCVSYLRALMPFNLWQNSKNILHTPTRRIFLSLSLSITPPSVPRFTVCSNARARVRCVSGCTSSNKFNDNFIIIYVMKLWMYWINIKFSHAILSCFFTKSL